ncbi:bacterial Ig-like domain-containing protein [Bacteroides eggerthii]|uniref:bacterial Ig-like domain-containing protein n=1 Tax=Bacteroides eggerthii TaxID=28111 RepID=UPI001C376C99|nr:bacterial Ig-like domain-containing protein [Bacteroides eggerthii]MBV3842514.1 bacterial Ig-like domain-containing protein [Bacteroides eggerthii]MBV3845433.1 bacterial Ig-like domain-containing protein [Bacteroides eggerthii]MBV3883611.1 bacterial Ig-like domain-containing protein [Bacteroides eggerthii]MBV3890558.1 bacterial Ig-like domain-containing protein [Bacteroides eggerthii]MBV3901719.1 bacterial Ig-like domain-containing protein [Bacteroides eggerthii]
MKHFYKITFFCCAAALWMLALASCEGGELYDVNAPEWISDKIQEIEDSKKEPEDEVLEGMQEDVYTIGNTDFTSGFWAAFSKYYVIPDGEKWNAVFNLNINPADNTYYKNFALIITNDVERGGEGYTEYGAIRFDVTGNPETYNSQWGDHIDFQYISGTLLLDPVDNKDENVQKLGGKVTLTVDRTSENAFTVKMTNGVATKTYAQPNKEPNLNVDASNTNIRCFLVPEGSYIDFLQTNIVPVGGLTSAADKNPVSMVLQNVPAQISLGTSLEEAMTNISAIVTFEEGVTKTVTASELSFSAIPDINQTGDKTLVAVYNKTFKGENCDKPIVANASFKVVGVLQSISITTAPSRTKPYYYTSEDAKSCTMPFDPTGMVVTGTYSDGSSVVIDNAKLSFSAIPAKAGSQPVTITAGENITATVNVTVSEATVVKNSTDMIGTEDNSTAFWGAHSDDFNVPAGQTKSITFTNYSSLSDNWNNFVVILRKADLTEYAVVRADNYGWGTGYGACTPNGTQGDWATWLAGMNGAKVTVYVTNCGNGTADVQAVMVGTTSTISTQCYWGINTIDANDLNFALTVDGCHLVFNN